MTYKAGTAFKADPAGSIKALFFLLIGLLLIFALYKFVKGLSKGAELLGELAPSTEAEKLEVISNPVYQSGIKWLDDKIGIETIVRKGGPRYKVNGVSTYLGDKKLAWSSLGAAAKEIWDAKIPGYIDQTIIYNTVSKLPSRAAVSLMAMEFNRLYKDKWNGGTLNAFLSKYLDMDELKNLTTIISKKPEL